MTDLHFLKEYEKKKDKASKDYLAYIKALSQIDGSHRRHLKVQRDSVNMFDDLHFVEGKQFSEEEMIRIIAGKSWMAGFVWAFENMTKPTLLTGEGGKGK